MGNLRIQWRAGTYTGLWGEKRHPVNKSTPTFSISKIDTMTSVDADFTSVQLTNPTATSFEIMIPDNYSAVLCGVCTIYITLLMDTKLSPERNRRLDTARDRHNIQPWDQYEALPKRHLYVWRLWKRDAPIGGHPTSEIPCFDLATNCPCRIGRAKGKLRTGWYFSTLCGNCIHRRGQQT